MHTLWLFLVWIGSAVRSEFMRQGPEWVILALACAMLGGWLYLRRRPHREPSAENPRRVRISGGVIALILATVAVVGSVTGFVGMFGGLLAQLAGLLAYWRFHRGKTTDGRAAGRAVVLGFVAVVVGLVFNAVWLDFSKSPL